MKTKFSGICADGKISHREHREKDTADTEKIRKPVCPLWESNSPGFDEKVPPALFDLDSFSQPPYDNCSEYPATANYPLQNKNEIFLIFPHMKFILLILTVFVCLVPVKRASALDTSLEFSNGYNDNVLKTPDAEGSAFCVYGMKLVQPLFSESAATDGNLTAEAAYQDYFSTGDNYRLQAGAELTWPLYEGRIIPGILSDVLFFRDDLLEEDERDELTAGAFADWLANPYLTLGIRQTWSWADYRNSADPCRSNLLQQSENTGGKGMNSGHNCNGLSESQTRDDRMQTTGIHSTFYFSPELEAEILGEYIRNKSSADTESYKENALSVSLAWNPAKFWEISVLGSARHFTYEKDRRNEERKDDVFHAAVRVSRFVGKFEFRVQAQWTHNDSSDENEDYRQQVMQCGIGFSF